MFSQKKKKETNKKAQIFKGDKKKEIIFKKQSNKIFKIAKFSNHLHYFLYLHNYYINIFI